MLHKKHIAVLILSYIFLWPCNTFAKDNNPHSFSERNPFLPDAEETTSSSSTNLLSSTPIPPPICSPSSEIHILKLNYIKANEIKDSLQSISPFSKISADPFSNSIILMASKEDALRLKKILKEIDIPSSQISLEAKIISINKEKSKSLGINWNWDTIPQNDISSSNISNSTQATNTHGNFKFWRGYGFKFSATLNALFSNGSAKLLASPHIITIPGKESSIFIGDHIPYQIDKHDSGGTYTSTEYIDAGILLKYNPILNEAENMITATVHTEVSTPTLVSELKNYKITSRKVDTTVRMKSDEALVIGGLITDEEQKAMQKVPLLGDIPILGCLFRNKTHKKNNTEILLVLTPHISKAGEAPIIYEKNRQLIEKHDDSGEI